MTKVREASETWLGSSLGQRLMNLEVQVVSDVLEDVFGPQLLQIGRWGPPDAFLRAARTQRRALLDIRPDSAHLCAEPEHLPVAGQSVDAVLLPHTLERSADPHQVLREADRVLTADGQLIVLGFSPIGPMGLRRLLAREPFPPAFERLLRQRRLKEWLSVLGFDVIRERRFFYALPFFVARWTGHTDRMEKLGGRWCSRLSCAYVLHAQKRVFRIVPVGRILRRRAPAVVGLAEPSTRNVA